MGAMQVLDPLQTPAAALDPAAQPVAAPGSEVAASPLAGVDAAAKAPLNQAVASELFGHVAAETATPTAAVDPGIVPHKVKSSVVRNDTGPLLEALTGAANVRNLKNPAVHDTVRSTTGNLLDAAGDAGLYGLNQFAYMMATTEREARIGTNMDEDYSGKDRDAYFERKYGGRADLDNTHKGDGAKYFGRGLVQVTGRHNYTNWTNRLNKEGYLLNGEAPDLVNHPDQALDPKLAAKITAEGMRDGVFTTRKLGNYVNDQQTDYLNARRVINGTDAAPEIAARAQAFQQVLQQNGNAFHGHMLESRLNKLPTAREPHELVAPTVDSHALFDAPVPGMQSHFGPVADLAKQGIGSFKPGPVLPKPKPAALPAHVPIPPIRPKDL